MEKQFFIVLARNRRIMYELDVYHVPFDCYLRLPYRIDN